MAVGVDQQSVQGSLPLYPPFKRPKTVAVAEDKSQ